MNINTIGIVSNYNQYQFQKKNKVVQDNSFKKNLFNDPVNDTLSNFTKKSNRDIFLMNDLSKLVSDYSYNSIQSNRSSQDTNYTSVETANYEIKALNEYGIFQINTKQGRHLGEFSFNDIYIRRDKETGKEFLISENGTAWYDAILLNSELKSALAKAIGVEELAVLDLEGYSVKTHAETAIQYLILKGVK